MRIGQGYRKATPSSPSEQANDATRKWVNTLVEAFESKDRTFVERFFDDSDDIQLLMEGAEPAVGREAVNDVYAWMFDADDHVAEWELRAATTIGNQIMFSLEDPTAAKGRGSKGARMHFMVEKSTLPGQEDKMRSFTLYGDYTKDWVDGYDTRGKSKRPNWGAKSKRGGRG